MKYKSPLLADAAGSLGGLTATRNQGGQFLRSRASRVNPNTASQNAVRSTMGALTSFWGTLTAEQCASWHAYAAQVLLPDTFGDHRLVSGFNHFIRSNTPRLRVLGPSNIISSAPSIFNLGATPILSGNMLAVAPFGELILCLTINLMDAPEVADDESFVFTYIAPPFSPSRSYYRGPYNYSTFGPVGSAASQPIEIYINSKHYWNPCGGQGVKVRCYQSQGDGRMSGDLYFQSITPKI